MRAVVQRALDASVSVDGVQTGRVEHGLVVYLGVDQRDTRKQADYIARKVAGLRIFVDEDHRMNLSVQDVDGGVLLISQFTLCADTKKGNRPSYNKAMDPPEARQIYEYVGSVLAQEYGIDVQYGIFGAHMDVRYCNDGPVTIILDTDD